MKVTPETRKDFGKLENKVRGAQKYSIPVFEGRNP